MMKLSNSEASKEREAPIGIDVWSDSVVVRDGVPVQYVYREEPDLTQEGDKHPDSGWRIRGDVSLMTDAQCENESADYLSLIHI